MELRWHIDLKVTVEFVRFCQCEIVDADAGVEIELEAVSK